MEQVKPTPEEIKILTRLNHVLAQKEKELLDRSRALMKAYEKRISKKGDLDGYYLDIYVEYHTGKHEPRFTYNTSVSKRDFEEKEEIFNRAAHWPSPFSKEPGNQWCYLMHTLWEKAENKDAIFKITHLWIEIHIDEQLTSDLIKADQI